MVYSFFPLSSVFLTLIGGLVLHSLLGFIVNLRKARKTGLAYHLSPVSAFQPSWQIVSGFFIPLIHRLPDSWTRSWYPFVIVPNFWTYGYSSFANLGKDNFFLVAPNSNTFWTCDPAVITQLLSNSRRADFVKPAEALDVTNLYGPSVAGTNGEEWRRYKKLTAPCFSEATHRNAWKQTIEATSRLLADWTRQDKQNSTMTVDNHESGIATLALSVMSRVCFGKSISSKGDNSSGDDMSAYSHVLWEVTGRVQTLLLTPRKLLMASPLPMHRKAYRALCDWRNHMVSMLKHEQELQKLHHQPQNDMNILSVISTAIPPVDIVPDQPALSAAKMSVAAGLSNMFTFLVAGHETTANTIAYSMLLLATHPHVQADLHKSLDAITNGCDPTEWTLDNTFSPLMNSLTGAIVLETLRLYIVIPFLPRQCMSEQALTIDNETKIIPANTLIFANSAAAHRHPKYWPHEKQPKDMDSSGIQPRSSMNLCFNPYAWLAQPPTASLSGMSFEDGGPKLVYCPVPGSFVPFADGPHTCIGQRFAKVEMVAVLARIYADYSVELDIGRNLDGLDAAQAESLWLNKRKEALRSMGDVKFTTVMKVRNSIPLRIRRRSAHSPYILLGEGAK